MNRDDEDADILEAAVRATVEAVVQRDPVEFDMSIDRMGDASLDECLNFLWALSESILWMSAEGRLPSDEEIAPIVVAFVAKNEDWVDLPEFEQVARVFDALCGRSSPIELTPDAVARLVALIAGFLLTEGGDEETWRGYLQQCFDKAREEEDDEAV